MKTNYEPRTGYGTINMQVDTFITKQYFLSVIDNIF